ncbi:MAG TPA: Gfo/Idh/MocA family oxidoreductase, partial [Chloroflexota bacterium]
DLLRWLLLEEVREVYAVGTRGHLPGVPPDTWDALHVLLRFEQTVATVETNWLLPSSWPWLSQYALTLRGSHGTIEVDAIDNGIVLAAERFEYPQPMLRYVKHGLLEGLQIEPIQDFVECVLEGREPRSGGEDGLAATVVAAAVERSLVERRPIAVEY